MEVIAIGMEAIAIKLEAIAIKLEAMYTRTPVRKCRFTIGKRMAWALVSSRSFSCLGLDMILPSFSEHRL